MHSFLSLPIYLLLLILPGSILADAVTTEPIAGAAPPKLTSRLPKLVRRVHASAAKRTHSLARDLRVAFGHLIPRDVDDEYNRRPVVYCKVSGQNVLQNPNTDSGDEGGSNTEGGGNSTGGSSTASTRPSTSTRTSSRPPQSSPTSDAPSSPWALTNSWVCTSLSSLKIEVSLVHPGRHLILGRLDLFHRPGPNTRYAPLSLSIIHSSRKLTLDRHCGLYR